MGEAGLTEAWASGHRCVEVCPQDGQGQPLGFREQRQGDVASWKPGKEAVLSKAMEQGTSTKGGGRAAKGRREELLWEVTRPQGWSRSLTRYGKTQ